MYNEIFWACAYFHPSHLIMTATKSYQVMNIPRKCPNMNKWPENWEILLPLPDGTRGTLRYSWRDPLGRFGMTQFVDVGPETTIWTFDPLCWSTNLLLCRKNPNVHFVVSPILSDTLCWFGSNNESTICTIDQFCWCGWLFLKSTFLMVDKFCWFVVDTESTIFVNWPDLTKSTDRLTFTQNNLLDG